MREEEVNKLRKVGETWKKLERERGSRNDRNMVLIYKSLKKL